MVGGICLFAHEGAVRLIWCVRCVVIGYLHIIMHMRVVVVVVVRARCGGVFGVRYAYVCVRVVGAMLDSALCHSYSYSI